MAMNDGRSACESIGVGEAGQVQETGGMACCGVVRQDPLTAKDSV